MLSEFLAINDEVDQTAEKNKKLAEALSISDDVTPSRLLILKENLVASDSVTPSRLVQLQDTIQLAADEKTMSNKMKKLTELKNHSQLETKLHQVDC